MFFTQYALVKIPHIPLKLPLYHKWVFSYIHNPNSQLQMTQVTLDHQDSENQSKNINLMVEK